MKIQEGGYTHAYRCIREICDMVQRWKPAHNERVEQAEELMKSLTMTERERAKDIYRKRARHRE